MPEPLSIYLREGFLRAGGENNLSAVMPARVDFRYGNLDGQPITRAAVYFANNGCYWKVGNTGGCTMCDLSSSFTSVPVSETDYSAQVTSSLEVIRINPQKVGEVDFYNDGSFFNDGELPAMVRRKIYDGVVSDLPDVKRVVVETLPRFVLKPSIEEAVGVLAEGGVRFEVVCGIESSSEYIRNKLLRKGASNKQFEEAVAVLLEAGAIPQEYVMIKPPLLSESEAIEDAIASVEYCREIGVSRVGLEPNVIGGATLQAVLNRLPPEHPYFHRPPWLWTIIEVLKKTRHLADIEVYSSIFMQPHVDKPIEQRLHVPHNCANCSHQLTEMLVAFHRTGDKSLIDAMDSHDCSCRSEWERELASNKPDPIAERHTLVNQLLKESLEVH